MKIKNISETLFFGSRIFYIIVVKIKVIYFKDIKIDNASMSNVKKLCFFAENPRFFDKLDF